MLNVSATQQLAKENEELKQEVQALKTQISKIQQLEEQNAQMKAMLEQIQSRLLSGQLNINSDESSTSLEK
jgi:cell shape-determining protein MreC